VRILNPDNARKPIPFNRIAIGSASQSEVNSYPHPGQMSSSEIGVAITGVAGPLGGTEKISYEK
jgi:hypothetical protein